MFTKLLWAAIVATLALLGWAFWQNRKQPERGRGLVVGAAGLLILLVLLSYWSPSGSPKAALAVASWEGAMGEIIGRQVSRLLPEGGRVLVFVTPASAASHLEVLAAQRKNQLAGLQRGLAKNLTLTVIEPQIPLQGPQVGTFSGHELQSALQTYPDAKAVVNFLWAPGGVSELAGVLPNPPPKLVLTSLTLTQAKAEIRAGRVAAAVVNRPDAPVDLSAVPQGDAQKIFDTRYLLLTAETLDKVGGQP